MKPREGDRMTPSNDSPFAAGLAAGYDEWNLSIDTPCPYLPNTDEAKKWEEGKYFGWRDAEAAHWLDGESEMTIPERSA